jgi:mRNA interferase RelE/StbE
MSYNITIRKKAVKFLGSINEPYYSRIKDAIVNLKSNPRPIGYKKLKGRNGYRIKVADYRIIYEIKEESKIVDILIVGHRKNIY